MYLPFLAKTCSSGMQLTMNSDGNTLCTSQMFTSLSLPVRSETSSCFVPINLMILKFGMYFAFPIQFFIKICNHYGFSYLILWYVIVFVSILLRTVPLLY